MAGTKKPTSLFCVALSVLCGGCLLGPTAGTTDDIRTLPILGEERSFVVHVPDGVTPSALVLAFHGSGSSGSILRRGTDLDGVARDLNAAVAYLDADHANWAEDCGGCTSADLVHLVADTAFVTGVAEVLSTEFGIPTDRFYAVGFSQGGLFVQRLACQMADRVRAVAVVAQTMAVTLSRRCDPARPVGVLDVLSFVDPVAPWAGTGDDVSSYLGAQATASLWHTLNGCDDDQEEIQEEGFVRYRYSGCEAGADVELIGINGGGHGWFISSRVSTGSEVVRFFRSH